MCDENHYLLSTTPPSPAQPPVPTPNDYHRTWLIVRVFGTQYGIAAAGAVSFSMIANATGAVATFGVVYFLLHYVDRLPWPWVFSPNEPASHRFRRRAVDSFVATIILFGSFMLSTIPETWHHDAISQRLGNVIFLGGIVICAVFYTVRYLTTPGRIVGPKHRPYDDQLFDYLTPR